MNVIGVIPARWASTRLPGKSLVSLCGKPMIQRVVERACSARSLSTVLVATDDAPQAPVKTNRPNDNKRACALSAPLRAARFNIDFLRDFGRR